MRIMTRSPEETEEFARQLAQSLRPGTFLSLTGDLGAGKTVFTRGLARGLGIEKDVPSPTFTLMRQYLEGRLPLYHFDVYRLTDEDELDDAGFFDASMADGVVVCEWADLFEDALPKDRIDVRLENAGELLREISVHGADDILKTRRACAPEEDGQ